MSSEQGGGSSSQKPAPTQQSQTQGLDPSRPVQQHSKESKQPATPPKLGEEPINANTDEDRKPAAKRDHPSDSTSPSTQDDPARPRQVIAVSASKGPTAFFNLARKFLVTDEMCDLSALEGAIVSAVDAAHLLERSQLATIVRIQTSYVTVEPKRRKQVPGSPPQHPSSPALQPAVSTLPPSQFGDPSLQQAQQQHGRARPSSGRELRRARIVITVKRTESYKQWLEENPLQAIIAGDGSEDQEEAATPSPDT